MRNLVRAVTRPWPGAFTTARGRRVVLWSAETVPAVGLTAGQVDVSGGLAVATGDGAIRPGTVQVEGYGELAWADAVRVLELGAGHRLGEETA